VLRGDEALTPVNFRLNERDQGEAGDVDAAVRQTTLIECGLVANDAGSPE
jgi:hypothetical protein